MAVPYSIALDLNPEIRENLRLISHMHNSYNYQYILIVYCYFYYQNDKQGKVTQIIMYHIVWLKFLGFITGIFDQGNRESTHCRV